MYFTIIITKDRGHDEWMWGELKYKTNNQRVKIFSHLMSSTSFLVSFKFCAKCHIFQLRLVLFIEKGNKEAISYWCCWYATGAGGLVSGDATGAVTERFLHLSDLSPLPSPSGEPSCSRTSSSIRNSWLLSSPVQALESPKIARYIT